jgi:uroporphyrinogen-III synthase
MRQVLVTRTKLQSEEMVEILRSRGFEVFCLPLIETVSSDTEIPETEYDIIVFTSPNSVEYFERYKSSVTFRWAVAVGAKTAAKLTESGIECDGMPEDFSSEGLVNYFSEIDVKDRKILLPGPEKRAGSLYEYLTGRGAKADKVVTYRTVPVQYEKGYVDKYIADKGIDIITLTAPSAAASLLSQTENLRGVTLVSIGRTTWKYLKDRGHESVYPQVQTIEGMAELMENLFKGV